MSRKPKSTQTQQTHSQRRMAHPAVVALIAFTAGSLSTWLVMRQPANMQTQTASSRSAPAELPPDTSQMSPAQAAVTLGNWHYDRKRWQQAIASYEQAIQLGLDNPNVRTDLGNCYRFSGQPQKALELYRIAQNQNPQHEQSLFNTAALYAQVLNDSVKAAEFAREYLRRFPQGQSVVAARQLLGNSEGSQDERESLVNWLGSQPPSQGK